MLKRVYFVLMAIIVILLVAVIAVFFVRTYNENSQAAAETSGSSIFEEVSNLEALELGIIDGETLREEHGVEGSGSDSSAEVSENAIGTVNVNMTLRSVQDDIKIKILNSETQKLIANVGFEVTVKGNDKTLTYTDTDRDGIIYISYVEAGDYTVFLSNATVDGTEYVCSRSEIITVTDSIEYTKIDVKDEIKTESEINVSEEDTKVQDVDETTDVQTSEETVETEESYDEDISDDAEDLLAQIEAESAAEEEAKNAQTGASSGTITAPAITSDPQYVNAHSGAKGLDVSKHNGNIDWNAVKASGINFAIIRCGYRGSSSGALIVDPYYYTNISGAQAAGINVGVYFFSQAVNEIEAVEEASMVLELISGYSLQMPVYIDVEKSNGRGDAISVEERSAAAHAFLSTISNAGYTAGIYSNKLWFENRINTSSFTGYKIWLAQYVDIPTYTATRYDMWQYTSKGSISGISGNVDMNVIK
ncbi:MAG: glycoside hydrolase family 25 protein [Butyrivibrio sp.]|nr:glycoside hydrolase family 25 protein [Butyrivibrio sp.]